MTDYWIWSNEHGAWWCSAERGYTPLLHEAGRYTQEVAERIIHGANSHLMDHVPPNEVAIPVINSYLPKRARQILADFDAVETLKEWTSVRRDE